MIRGLHRSLCTEARISIRESLKSFRGLQDADFETLAFNWSKKHEGNVFQFSPPSEVSCGNFVHAFSAMFLSRNQTTRHSLNQIVDGSALRQYMGHPNIVLHSSLMIHERKDDTSSSHIENLPTNQNHCDHDDYCTENNFLFRASRKFCDGSSLLGCHRLARQLLKRDVPQELPRVFLVSLSFAFLQPTTHIKDHKFVLVKYDNNNFQLLQNYIAGRERKGINLIDWQTSTNTEFSSPTSFYRDSMKSFLGHLKAFATGESFDNQNYMAMFGVLHSRGSNASYMSGVSHTEIDDDCIIGSGFRCMADDITIENARLVKERIERY